MFTPDLDENTEKLSNRARALINAEFRTLLGSNLKTRYNNQSLLRVSSPPPQSASKSSRRCAVKTARKKIQDEWDALKNATIISNNSFDEKTSQILIGVVAYIEINNVPKSITLKVILEKLGATVKDQFTPEVTHVIFKKGTFETFTKAKLLNVHLVSVQWLEACRDSRKRIAEKLFPVNDHKDYTSPKTFRKLMELNPEQREQVLKNKNVPNIVNKKRNLRSSEKSPEDSSESALVLQISTDDSGNKNKEIKKTKETSKPAPKKRLFASVGDEMIDQHNTEKKNNKTKRKLFTNRLEDSSLNDNTSECTETINVKEKNPYQVAGKKRIARKKTHNNNKEKQKRPIAINSSDSTLCSNNSTLDNLEQVKELIKLTQTQLRTAKKVVKIKKVKENKITKEEKENIKKANKIARRYKNQTIKASQPRSCRKINVYSRTIKHPSLVSTYLHKHENKWLRECIDHLGGFVLKAKVEKDTTHIVVGQPVRTVNLLKGLCRGCWLVDKRWVHDSLTAGHWLTEYDYELADFSRAVQKNRLERQILGDDYHTDILNNVGTIYIGKNCLTKAKDLKCLIALCDGKQVWEPNVADIIVGEKVDEKICVSEHWLLDTMASGKCKNTKKYTLL